MPVLPQDRCNADQPCPVCGDTKQHCFFLPDRTGLICMDQKAIGLGKPTRMGNGTFVPLAPNGSLSGRNGRRHVPAQRPVRPSQPAGPVRPPLDRTFCDQVYRALIQQLTLLPDHEQHLLDRGFTLRWIRAHGYRSFRPVDRARACQQLLAQWPPEELAKVPGFRLGSNGQLRLVGWPGLLIPIMDLDRRVQACQVRAMPDLSSDQQPRYTWLSTADCSSGTPIHVSFPQALKRPYLFFTEGPLKSDYIAYRFQAFSLAAAGVSCWNDRLEELVRAVQAQYPDPRQLQFLIANDYADYGWTSEGRPTPVTLATYQLASRLLALTDQVWILGWPRPWKGLDDYLQAGGRCLWRWPVLLWLDRVLPPAVRRGRYNSNGMIAHLKPSDGEPIPIKL